ncbi:MAG: hypothetical protein JXC36_00555 [Candidatus Atribacteria bacterium]|nr:hypothetical protein [Candidatus Atribacteria bacterium]
MGNYKSIIQSTKLEPQMKIREFLKGANDYNNYVIGEYLLDDDKYEVYPEGVNYLDSDGVLFYFSKSDMISKNCEYWDD